MERSNKQSDEELLIEKAWKSTMQKLCDQGIFDGYDNADEKTKSFLLIERRRPDSEELKDDVVQGFYSNKQFGK